jgi:hypothetical protein
VSRTIIDIPAPLLNTTDELCQVLGVSRAEIVRRALREFLKRNEAVKTDGFGLWAEPVPKALQAGQGTHPGLSAQAQPAAAPARQGRRGAQRR